MKKWKKKPVIIEAGQWFKLGDVEEAPITKWTIAEKERCDKCNHPMEVHEKCETLEGHHIVCPGDYIIKGIQGEFYPCKSDIFHATYERVDE